MEFAFSAGSGVCDTHKIARSTQVQVLDIQHETKVVRPPFVGTWYAAFQKEVGGKRLDDPRSHKFNNMVDCSSLPPQPLWRGSLPPMLSVTETYA